ncbi:acyl-CoA dehydrogenase C-terminal domain-containing protein [Pseudomaricurvus sp. HS19]|uniref:acyl-CoA dehydrogenase C-terminal domain-containing protein n=1 Tax=Pseudomaricurvus sp. HS19 TaxID=2692626 RepID=UPI00136EA22A|nr:acyl-CoA dehydrogenase C-terminal domain-containing protein [Pseudomaricurvus sp. HS19]MYM64416.1 acyl-CoA dehydrogenase [Pseudomaricurvus sp. HS19]
MPEYKAPLRDMQFAINEVLKFDQHYQNLPGAEDATPDTVAAILDEAAKFCEQVVSPLNPVGDREGCRWQDGKVSTPTGFKAAYDQFIESGWPGLSQKVELGGQGLPSSVNAFVYEMLASASHAWSMYPSLSWGAIKTVAAHASEELQQRYLPKLISGHWSGTMCLTESHCGSDLGLLRTKATPNDDGTYNISGSKIFISAGDHDLTENIVHIVLARLPDAPEGVGGISLFLVPKFWIDESGNAGDSNGVTCGSIEHKMGIHGNATCVLNFDSARGYLISAPHKGMSAMFTFINESRLGVAQQGQAHIESSFQGALAYAKERVQMRAPVRVLPDKPADPIIAHPDVRRMLLTQKSLAEGARLLNYYCAQLVDISHDSADAAERERAETELALLTPIAKGFITEMSMEATSNGVQVLGGHGYIAEWGMEQEYRDTRITAIYEGTNGIQGLDLLGRKILASGGKVAESFMKQVTAFCQQGQPDAVAPLVVSVQQSLQLWQSVTEEVGAKAMAGDKNAIGAAAYDYLMIAGYATLAYFLVRGAAVAAQALEQGSGDGDFYRAKIANARFYCERLLPRAQALASSIRSGADNLMDMGEGVFGL